VLLAAWVAFMAGCSAGGGGTPRTAAADHAAVTVTLSPGIPDAAGKRRLGWSPYGEKLTLSPAADGGLSTELVLGPAGTPPIGLELARSPDSKHYDLLRVDFNRDGRFEDAETLRTKPTESRHKLWSTFDTVVDVPVVDPATRKPVDDPYPLSFWYVEDPASPEEANVLRFSRRGWMEGRATLGGVEAEVLVTENAMDGVYDTLDAWALAPADSADQVLGYKAERPLTDHAWLGEKAYEVTSVDPSGRRVVVAPTDPGITREAEAVMNDHLRVDREAARSGDSIAFLHDFAAARVRAQRAGEPLFIDFETTWCGPCHLMDQWVYTADSVVAAGRSVVAVKVDGDDHPDIVKAHDVVGYPTMILLSADGKELRRLTGYVNVVDMTAFLKGSR
jgi:thiol-disulfide isomerase/thioredoxin